ncbi:serine/threonine-protein kinase [Streptomyces sp. NPDC048516]|uniref:serine/threonine-protein kinase n=1 Tax=Streptomyces sp. NPDC048516 TaxID=3365565 RepID=UPI00371DCF25
MKLLGPGDPVRLGPYRILGVLGEGGMGKVYLGRDSAGQATAVKVLRPELAFEAQMSQRFVREAQAAQAVTSKGVARVLGAWLEGGRPWMATEFLAGPTLDQAVEEHGPFNDQGVRELAAALARTLQDIHDAGLVHRDLKPSNIVLTSTGPRIIDFGIARPEHGLTLTTTGQIPVTPGYGAPEQVMGQRVGPPGDVFSLGAVLAYAASGRRTFDGGHVAAIQYEVVHGEPDLSQVPEPLRALVAPCLAKDPAHRPLPQQIAMAMAPPDGTRRGAKAVWQLDALASDIKRSEAAAKQQIASADTLGSAGPSRRRLVAALAAGGTVLAAGGTGAAWWLLSKDNGASGGGGIAASIADEKEAPAVHKPSDAKRLSASQYRTGTAPPPLWGPQQGAGLIPFGPLPVGDLVLINETGSTVGAYEVTGGRRKWSVDCDSNAHYAAPSERLVVTAHTLSGLVVLDAVTGKQKWTVDARVAQIIAADAKSVYFTGRGDGATVDRLSALDIASRSMRWSVPLEVDSNTITPPAAATGSGRLVLCGKNGTVVALDTRTGKTVWKLPRQANALVPIAPAVSGETVYLGGKTLTARRLKDGKEVWSVAAKSTAGKNEGGWSGPAIDGDALYAMDGTELSRRDKRDGKTDWALGLGITAPLSPPVVQGESVWAAMDITGKQGIAAVHKDTGKKAWTYARDGSGDWAITGAGNRIFLMHQGTLTAMPVF